MAPDVAMLHIGFAAGLSIVALAAGSEQVPALLEMSKQCYFTSGLKDTIFALEQLYAPK